MGVQLLNSNFTSGELTPLLLGRVNFERYNKGAQKLDNVIILPQGGITNRFGTNFIVKASETDADEIKLGILNYNDVSKYVLVFEPLVLKIYLGSILKKTISTTYVADQITDLKMAQSGNRMEIVHEKHNPAVLFRDDSDDTIWTFEDITFRNKPVYDFEKDYDRILFTPGALIGYDITLTASEQIFETRHVGGTFEGNGGLMRITAIVLNNQVKGNIYVAFNDSTTIKGSDAYLTEPVFSDSRGWPKTIDFYQGRQFYGGTTEIPGGTFGSATYDITNYDDTGATPSDAISIILSGEETNIIRDIIDAKDLFVFTTNAEYSTPPFTDKPASPENTYFIKQDTNGMADVDPVILDNKVVYVDRGGKIVRAMVYSVDRAKYQSLNMSVLSPHLIRDPVSAAVFRNPEINDGSYMLLINADGTIAVFQYIEEQKIACWNLAITDGSFKQVVASGSDVIFLVEREVGTRNELFIEKINFDILFDSAVDFTFGSPESVISGLDHLNGKTIQIIGDGVFIGTKIVGAGTVTLDEPVTHFQAGLPIEWTVIPMPAQYQTEQGNNKYLKKRVKTIYLDYYLSLGIKVNGQPIPGLQFNTDSFSDDVELKTGIYEYSNMGGWNRDEIVTISGNEPLRFSIRSITYEVEQ